MNNNDIKTRVRSTFVDNGQLLVFFVLLLVFAAYTIFLALNLQPGIIPDESYRFAVSRYFVNTWGIPDDVPIIESAGESLHRGSFLGYWIFGRMLAIFSAAVPNAVEWQALVYLRLVNAFFSWGTVFITFLLAKEIINIKWLQILPVFMLTNTLMFVFLSSGVNYDNPTIFFCALGLFFLIRVIKDKDLIHNSLGWLIMISIATLIKYSILPLAFVMGVIWIAYIFKKRNQITLIELYKLKNILLFALLLPLLFINFCTYGINIIRYGSLIPSCLEIYTREICEVSSYTIRHQEMALPEKLTVTQAFRQGDPEPIRFIFDFWFRAMLDRIYGIMGHKIYFPISVSYFMLMIYWTIGLGMRYIRRPSFIVISMLSVIGFYALVLVRMNYNSELVYGFGTAVALQGRYIFPVISLAYVFWGFILENVSNKLVRYATLIPLIALFLYGGPIRFILYYSSVFKDWFI